MLFNTKSNAQPHQKCKFWKSIFFTRRGHGLSDQDQDLAYKEESFSQMLRVIRKLLNE